MKLSIVTTLYRSEQHVATFHRRADAVARELVGNNFEIVMVNDGSPDDSLEIAIRLAETEPRLVVVDLSRNFGHHKAMMTGLDYATGDLVFLIDSDLEEAPEWLTEFYQDMRAQRADVVFGQQSVRKGGLFEKWSGEIYYSLLDALCNIDHPRNITTARLMTRRYVDALLRHRESELVISCLWVITGFKQVARLVAKGTSSKSSYTLWRKLSLAASVVSSFSDVPLKFVFAIGLTALLGSVSYTGYLIFQRVFLARAVDGWTSIMASIWLLGGLIIFCVGLIGLYLAKVFNEVKQRPYTIVREVYGKPKA